MLGAVWLVSELLRSIKGKHMSVELRSGESQESILRRFRKSVMEARIIPLARNKRWFVSKSEVRRIKKNKAIRKAKLTAMAE